MNEVIKIKPGGNDQSFLNQIEHKKSVLYQTNQNYAYFKNSVHELLKVCTKQAIHNTLEKLLGENNAIKLQTAKGTFIKTKHELPLFKGRGSAAFAIFILQER